MVAELRRASAALLESPPLPPAGLEELARRNARRHNRRRALTGAVVAVLAVIGLTVAADGGPGTDKKVVTVDGDRGTLAVAQPDGVLLVPIDGGGGVSADLGGTPVRLAWSPDGEWLAAQVGTELVFVRRDGTGVRHVELSEVGGFRWSPVGDVLLVQTMREGVFTVTPAGEPRHVFDGGADAVFSPDGKRIVYQDFRLSDGGLHVVDADGTDDRLLGAYSDLPEASKGLQVRGWSTDGSHVLYRSHDISANPTVDGHALVAVAVEDGSTFELGLGYSRSDWIQWAPTGGDVLFVTGAGPALAPQPKALRRCDLVARSCTDLTPADGIAFDPQWSPDGRRIAYVAGSTSTSDTHVRVVAADGSDDHAAEEGAPGARWPAWVGDHVVYVHVGDDLVVLRVAADGGEPEVVSTQHLERIAVGGAPTTEVLTAWSPGARGGVERPR